MSSPPPPNAPSLPEDPRAHALHTILVAAGHEGRIRFRDVAVHRKADGTAVTEADTAAEAVIAAGLAAHFPDDGVRSEEGTRRDAAPGHGTWYVDPIDGTSAFTEGLAWWGPTLARVSGDTLEVGAFYVPLLDTFFFAAPGAGAWRDGERLAPAEPVAGDPQATILLPSRAHRTGPLDWPGKSRGLGSTAAHLALVASGGAAATVIPHWSTWDVGAGLLLVREAGRKVVDLSGADFDPMTSPGAPFIAGAPSVLPGVCDAIRRALAPLSPTRT